MSEQTLKKVGRPPLLCADDQATIFAVLSQAPRRTPEFRSRRRSLARRFGMTERGIEGVYARQRAAFLAQEAALAGSGA